MKCLYCQTETNGSFCSQDHKKKFNDGIENAFNKFCPVVVFKDLDKKHEDMQNEWKKKNKKKAKLQCLGA